MIRLYWKANYYVDGCKRCHVKGWSLARNENRYFIKDKPDKGGE